MQLLLIKVNALDAKPEYALLGKKQLEDRFTPGEWSKIRSISRGRRILLLIPNNDIVLTSISIPSKNKKQLLQAIPYALEDTLAEDIEELHFAIHKNEDDPETQVAIINHALLESYIGLLKREGITTHFVLPQLLTQASAKDAWSINKWDDDSSTVSIRLDDFSGFNCDQSMLEVFLEQHKAQQPSVIYSNLEINQLPETLQELPLERFDSNSASYNSVVNSLPLNLIIGFVSRTQGSSVNFKAWRPALVLGSLLAVTWIGIFEWQNNALLQEKNQLTLAIENTFTTAFPKSRIVDPAQQMTVKLAQLKKNVKQTVTSPLPLISDISPLLKDYKDITLKEIRYKENELVFVMQSPNLTRLETFKKDAIKKSGLQVDIKNSTTTANKVEATLIISPLKLSAIDQEKA